MSQFALKALVGRNCNGEAWVGGEIKYVESALQVRGSQEPFKRATRQPTMARHLFPLSKTWTSTTVNEENSY